MAPACPPATPGPRTLAAVAVGGELHPRAALADEAALGVDTQTLAGSAQALVNVWGREGPAGNGGVTATGTPPAGPAGPPQPGSPVQRMPLGVSTMEKPRGQTRATSWHPPWLQDRSQPYSPHVPGGSGRGTGGPQGHRCHPRAHPRLPASSRMRPPLRASLPGTGMAPGDAAGRGDKERCPLPGQPGGLWGGYLGR